MSYQRDFTIGLRETQDFYLSLVLGHWRKGIAGFALVGALAALLYTMNTDLMLPVKAAVVLAGALAGAAVTVIAVSVSTLRKVREQVRRSGREQYVQETEINGFGVHVTVGKDRGKMGFECFISSSRKIRPGSCPRRRWRTGKATAPGCGSCSRR